MKNLACGTSLQSQIPTLLQEASGQGSVSTPNYCGSRAFVKGRDPDWEMTPQSNLLLYLQPLVAMSSLQALSTPQRSVVKNYENTTTPSSPTPSSHPIQLRFLLIWHFLSFPGDISGKEPACQYRRLERHGFDPWIRKIPWRRAWQPTVAFLPRESHGQRSLASHSPWGQESQTRLKRLSTHAYGKPSVTPQLGQILPC